MVETLYNTLHHTYHHSAKSRHELNRLGTELRANIRVASNGTFSTPCAEGFRSFPDGNQKRRGP